LTNSGTVSWSASFGGNYHDRFQSVAQTTDGGFIIAGETASSNLPNYHVATTGITSDFFIVKINSTGTLMWQKLYGGAGGDLVLAVIQTKDGGFAVAGYNGGDGGDVTDNRGFDDAWLLKLNNTGSLLWQKSYGGSSNDDATSLVENADGSITMACTSGSTDGDITNYINGRDYWIVKTNGTNGNIIWQKKYGGTGRDDASSVKTTSDGGWIVTGYSTFDGGDVTDNNGSTDFWILKLNGAITSINPFLSTNNLDLKLYPNPVENILKIDSLKIEEEWLDLKIINLLGANTNFEVNLQNKNAVTLNISTLKSGLYFALLRRKNGKTTQIKFLKN
jgi:hypothetical protein